MKMRDCPSECGTVDTYAVNMWDFLPEHVVNAPSVDSFKNRLDKQWSNEEILYDYKAATPAGRKPFAPA